MARKSLFMPNVFLATMIIICLLPAFSYAQCTREFDGAAQVATSYGDALIFEGNSITTPNALLFEFYYFLGGPSAPGIYRIEDDPVNDNYSTCHTCVLIWDSTGSMERIFFATAGELNIQSIGPSGIPFTGTLSNANFIEVTIDWDTFVSTPVPGGETRCIETFSFDTLIGGPTMDSDGDGLSDYDEGIYGTDPQNPDTDGGGVSDGQEVLIDGTDPLDPADDLLPIDADGDGYPTGEDCNDADPTINPGTQEIWYDGIDQNCDGRNDFDQDMDGSLLDEDCDDTNPLMSPGIITDFCDGYDNDCDDQIDEDRQGSCIAVQLTWQTPGDPVVTDNDGTDLDLHFLHPLGDWFDTEWDCFWQNRNPNWGDPVSLLDDPSLDIDDTNGVGPEAIHLENPEAATVYKVGVHYFSDHGYGPSYATVKVFFNGVLAFEETGKLLHVREFWEVAAIDWDAGTVTHIDIVKPAAIDDITDTVVNSPVSIDVLSNDSSPEGNPLFMYSFDTVSLYGGMVSCDTTVTTPTPQCLYTPPPGFVGTDLFTYDATDGISVSLRANVFIEVSEDEDGDGDGIPDSIDVCPNENASGLDADRNGCIDSVDGLQDMLQTLESEGIISSKLNRSLEQKVQNASRLLDKAENCPAVNIFRAFINEINAQRGKLISADVADLIIEYAENVVQRLLAQLPPDKTC